MAGDPAKTAHNGVSGADARVCPMPERDRSTARLLASTGPQVRDCFRVADDSPRTTSFASHNAELSGVIFRLVSKRLLNQPRA